MSPPLLAQKTALLRECPSEALGLLSLILLYHGGEFFVLLCNTDKLVAKVRLPHQPASSRTFAARLR